MITRAIIVRRFSARSPQTEMAMPGRKSEICGDSREFIAVGTRIGKTGCERGVVKQKADEENDPANDKIDQAL